MIFMYTNRSYITDNQHRSDLVGLIPVFIAFTHVYVTIYRELCEDLDKFLINMKNKTSVGIILIVNAIERTISHKIHKICNMIGGSIVV